MRGRRRGALGAAALGVALILLAGLFDAEPLYVPGIALIGLAVIAVVWVSAAARGLQVRRVVTATRVEEGEPLLVVIEVGTGRIVPPAGDVLDPLLAEPAALGSVRRGTRVRIRARFARRGRRLLPPPSVVVRDPLGLTATLVTGDGAPDEVLVLPRVDTVRAPDEHGGRATNGHGLRAAGAEADLDGLRPHRPGAPASRIAWQVYARSGELHERSMRAGGDSRPLVVLDLSGTAVEEDADAAVRAAASLVVHLARRGGCALLIPGDRRPLSIEPGLRGWPHAHARLALAEIGTRPQLAALAGRPGALIWVSARPRREPPRALVRAPARVRVHVVPGVAPGRKALFTVAGCTGYAMDGRLRAGQATAAATAAAGGPA